MGLFDKIINAGKKAGDTIKKTADKVEDAVSKETNKVEKNVAVNSYQTIHEVAAKEIGELNESFHLILTNANEMLQYKQRANDEIARHKPLLELLTREGFNYISTHQGQQTLSAMKAAIQSSQSTNHIAAMQSSPEMKNSQQEAKSRAFNTISFGLAADASLIVGPGGSLGQAGEIGNGKNNWANYGAVEGTAGFQIGAAGDAQFGIWTDLPNKMAGTYIGLEFEIYDGAGASGAVFFSLDDGHFLGFLLAIGGGAEVDLGDIAIGHTWTWR